MDGNTSPTPHVKYLHEVARTMFLLADGAGDADEGMYREVVITAIHTTSPSALAGGRCRRGKCLRC